MIREIGEAGMTCVSDMDFEAGDEYTAVWKLGDGAPPLQVMCVVRHHAANHTGVQFVNVTLSDRVRISSYISARAAEKSKPNGGA